MFDDLMEEKGISKAERARRARNMLETMQVHHENVEKYKAQPWTDMFKGSFQIVPDWVQEKLGLK